MRETLAINKAKEEMEKGKENAGVLLCGKGERRISSHVFFFHIFVFLKPHWRERICFPFDDPIPTETKAKSDFVLILPFFIMLSTHVLSASLTPSHAAFAGTHFGGYHHVSFLRALLLLRLRHVLALQQFIVHRELLSFANISRRHNVQ